jgi:hypothetical protein
MADKISVPKKNSKFIIFLSAALFKMENCELLVLTSSLKKNCLNLMPVFLIRGIMTEIKDDTADLILADDFLVS